MWFSNFFKERIGQPRKALPLHAHGEVLALGKRRADMLRVRVAFDPLLAGTNALARNLASGRGIRPGTVNLEQHAIVDICSYAA
jgi:hypothetical protein